MTAYNFDKQGARRIVDAVRKVEANDTLRTGQQRRRHATGAGAEQFIIARVTEVDATDPLLLSVTEQYWSEADTDMIDLPGGRVWNGASENPPKVRSVDGQQRGVDDLVTLGFRFGNDGDSVWFVVPEKVGMFRAKITASSSGSEDHTFVEIDADDAELTGGRTATDAKAMNARKGVPVDTYTIVFDLGPTAVDGDPVYKFIVTDGLTDSPKDLTSIETTANEVEWNVEEDSEAVTYDASRTALAAETVYFFDRQFIADASGFTIDITEERASFITADSADSAKLSHITMVDFTNAGVDGKLIRLNQAQADHNTLIFSPGTGIELNAGTADVEVEVDDSGRLLLANGGADVTITISATGGGGSADGQGYESVTDGTTTLNKTDGGIIAFSDTSNSSTTLGVNFAVANNDPTATVTATVDASGLTAADVGGAEVLDIEFRIADTVSEDDTFTIDSADYRGILFHGYVTTLNNSTAAAWETYSAASMAIDWYHASSETFPEDFATLSAYNFFIDASDGHKLKIRITSKPSGGNTHFGRILITKGSPKTAADATFA